MFHRCASPAQSLVLFATLQQAHGAQAALSQHAPAAISLKSVPLHTAPSVGPPTGPQPAAPLPAAPQAQRQAQQPLPAQPLPDAAPQGLPPPGRPPLPPGMRAQALPQRDGVGATMRPLYAAPGRPTHMVGAELGAL